MKKSLKKLQFKKEVVTSLETQRVIGGKCGPTLVLCHSTPIDGRILCQLM